MQDTLLVEVLTEELPPKALFSISNIFGEVVAEELAKQDFRASADAVQIFATPRRFAVQLDNVLALQPDQNITRKGPSVKAGLKDGEPTPALTGFAKSCGVSVEQLKVINDGKQDVYAYESTAKGKSLAEVIEEIIHKAIKKLPIPKLMHWGDSPYLFVRPVHGLMILHGADVVEGELFGHQSGNTTLGHRFLSEGKITIGHAKDYQETLREKGNVVVSFAERKAFIERGLVDEAKKFNATIVADEALLNEVTAIVELPVILSAGFDESFLKVPQECLILTMQQNQKYFPLVDGNNKLINHFLLVSNLKTADSSHITHGNERVLRARLSDAAFFFEQDKKQTLESRLPKLNSVVYQNKLGSVGQRIERIETLAKSIAQQLGADTTLAAKAARLAKADLVTEMVGEFPELQGTMGKYYALHDKENPEVALAIEQHYQPRFANDNLPEGKIALAVALADKLETLVGIWGIGLQPTGDKDPYALRRAALGVLRILLQQDLNLKTLLQEAFNTFPSEVALDSETCAALYQFMLTRLSNLLQHDYSIDVINAVLDTEPEVFNDLEAKLAAVTHFKSLPEAKALAEANKRVQNVLKKNPHEVSEVKAELLQQDEEKALYQLMQQLQPKVSEYLVAQDFQQALTVLASLQVPVDAFFSEVMVMAEDLTLRANRLNLLETLKTLLNGVADIAKLTEQ